MDPQKTPSSPQPVDGQQNSNPGGVSVATPMDSQPAQQQTSVGLAPLSEEAASAEMPASPVAGQMIEPSTAVTAANVKAAAEATSGVGSLAAPQEPASSPDSASEAPFNPLPVGAPKHRKKGLFAGAIIAAALLLMSGGAAATYYYVVNKPENVLKRALANTLDTSKTKTIQFNGSLEYEESKSGMKIGATAEGSANLESGAYDVSSEVDAVVTKLTLDSRSTDGKTFYFKVGGLKGLPQLMTGVGGLSADDATMAMYELYASYLESFNDQWIEVNESLVSQAAGSQVPGQELTEDGRMKIVEAYGQNEFLVVKEKLPEGSVKGVSCYHYKVGVDKEKLKAFFATFKNSDVEELKLTQDQLESLNKSIDDTDFDALATEIWISKSDKMIRQLKFVFEQEDDKVTVRLTADSYNKSVEVEKPAGAKSLLEMTGELLGGSGLESGLTLPAGEAGGGISL